MTADQPKARLIPTNVKIAAGVIAFMALIYACTAMGGGPSASAVDACKKSARAAFGNDYTSVASTHTVEVSGVWEVKGTVSETRGGKTSVAKYWECSDGKITWSSDAG